MAILTQVNGTEGVYSAHPVVLMHHLTPSFESVFAASKRKTRLSREASGSREIQLIRISLPTPSTPFILQPFQSFKFSIHREDSLCFFFGTCHICLGYQHVPPPDTPFSLPLPPSSSFSLGSVLTSSAPELVVDCLGWRVSPETNPEPGI